MSLLKSFFIFVVLVSLSSQVPINAQSWAWAVFHNGSGAIWVANHQTPPDPNVWTRMDSYAFRSQTEAQNIACMLVTKGDLFNRKYTSVQISTGAWTC